MCPEFKGAVATVVLLLVHETPVADESLNMAVDPTQIVNSPKIGDGLFITVFG